MGGIGTANGPRLRAVAAEQVRLVGLKLRWKLALLAASSVGLAGIFAWEGGRASPETPSRFGDAMFFFAVLAAGLVAISAWTDEGPGRRAYHWAMPVPRWLHSLTRIGAGAIWLIAVLAAGTLIAVAAGLVTPVQCLGWAVAVLLVYLLASTAALLSDHPDRWIVGVPAVYMILGLVIALVVGPGDLLELWISIVHGRLGFVTALAGAMKSNGEWAAAAALWLVVAGAGIGSAIHYRRE